MLVYFCRSFGKFRDDEWVHRNRTREYRGSCSQRSKEDAMKRTIGYALASGLAFLVAGCAAGGGGAGTGASAGGGSAPAGGNAQTASATGMRDFNLQVKCPGIHLEKTKLKWDDDKIMSHENVTPEEIASCEAFTAAQPKGYVPPPPGGAPAPQASNGGTTK
jgi:hypothetical protein